MIDFEEEIQRFKPSLEVEAVSDAIIKSDLTDMAEHHDGDHEGDKGKIIYGLFAEDPVCGQQLL